MLALWWTANIAFIQSSTSMSIPYMYVCHFSLEIREYARHDLVSNSFVFMFSITGIIILFSHLGATYVGGTPLSVWVECEITGNIIVYIAYIDGILPKGILQVGPFWQDTIDIWSHVSVHKYELDTKACSVPSYILATKYMTAGQDSLQTRSTKASLITSHIH